MSGIQPSLSIDQAVLEHYIGAEKLDELDSIGFLPGARGHVLLEQFSTISNIAINNLLDGIRPERPLLLEPQRYTEGRPYHFPLVEGANERVGKAILATKPIDNNTTLVATAYHDSFFRDEDTITEQNGIYAIDLSVSYKTAVSVSLDPLTTNSYPRLHDEHSFTVDNNIISEFVGTYGGSDNSRVWADARFFNDPINDCKTVATRALWVALLDPDFRHPNIK